MSDLKYDEAMSRLETILAELEEGKKSVDELADLVKEASALVKACRNKLKTTEEDIKKAFDGA
ncbi:exodeoxyribonuclease VII small subunit [Algoriphagus sp.]|uniref:exodeoxyribonuclease VII small subunit n=1 Tax=Algoriphagus sp. TaxID=1872435 RepID=UPI003268790A